MDIHQITESVMNVLPGRKREQPQLTRKQAMSARPVRNPTLKWREEDGEVVIILPRRRDWVGKLLAWAFFVPESRPIQLDSVGSHVWGLCDGTNTVEEIVDEFCDKYQLGKREAQVSLTEFFKMLGKRGMVGFLVDKKTVEHLDEDTRDLVGLEEVGSTEDDLRRVQEEGEGSEAEGEDEPDDFADDEDDAE